MVFYGSDFFDFIVVFLLVVGLFYLVDMVWFEYWCVFVYYVVDVVVVSFVEINVVLVD